MFNSNTDNYAFVASTGGHLEQLTLLAPQLCPDESKQIWYTFRNSQSETLLRDKRVVFLDYIPPRGLAKALRAAPRLLRSFREENVGHVASTGAAIAVPALYVASLLRLQCTYIESLARSDGPSLSGRIVARLPNVDLYCQYESWAQGRWKFQFTALDSYVSVDSAPKTTNGRPLRVFVSLGTIRPYGFRSLVNRVLEVAPEGSVFRWQTGSTNVHDLDLGESAELSKSEFSEALEWADVFVSHAGVGSALAALKAGVVPVLVPRRAERSEHIDDHQEMICRVLSGRELAVTAEVSELSATHLDRAQQLTVLPLNPPAEPSS